MASDLKILSQREKSLNEDYRKDNTWGRFPRQMIIYRIYNSCSIETVGRVMKQIYEKTLIDITSEDPISFQQEKLMCLIELLGTFACSHNESMLEIPKQKFNRVAYQKEAMKIAMKQFEEAMLC